MKYETITQFPKELLEGMEIINVLWTEKGMIYFTRNYFINYAGERTNLLHFYSCCCPLAQYSSIFLVGDSEGFLSIFETGGKLTNCYKISHLPINQIISHEDRLYIQIGEESMISIEFNEALLKHQSVEDIIKENACIYSLDRKINSFQITKNIDNWPIGIDTEGGKNWTKVIIAGQKPFLQTFAIPPAEDALPDPLSMASEYISNKMGSWFTNKKPSSPLPLDKKLPRAFPSFLASIDDDGRSFDRIDPIPGSTDFLLFDCKNGRLLRFDPQLSLFTLQIKGLRGALYSIIQVNNTSILLVVYPKRSHIALIDLSNGEYIYHSILPSNLTNVLLLHGEYIVACTIDDKEDNSIITVKIEYS